MPLKPFIHSLTPALLALIILSCGGSNNTPDEPKPNPTPSVNVDVYAAGYNNAIPLSWTNGAITTLSHTSGYDAKAFSVFASGNNVYIAGREEQQSTGNLFPVLWTNKTFQRLNTGNYTNVLASSVFVTGNDVYVAGDGYGSEGNNVPLLWKNGVPTPQYLRNSSYSAFANSCFVSGNDTYVVGTEHGWYFGYPTIWKNGVAQYLGNARADVKYEDGNVIYATASSVYVANNNVYVAGREMDYSGRPIFIAVLWRNNQTYVLTNPSSPGIYYESEAYSVFANGNDVYVAGYERNAQNRTVAKLWKLAFEPYFTVTEQSLSDGSYDAFALSVFVINGNVYVSGCEYRQETPTARLWQNSVAQNIGNGIAYSVFAKNK